MNFVGISNIFYLHFVSIVQCNIHYLLSLSSMHFLYLSNLFILMMSASIFCDTGPVIQSHDLLPAHPPRAAVID